MTDTFTGRDKQSGLPPDAIFLNAIQAAHLTKIHIDIISTQLAAGVIWYAVPGPHGPIPKMYSPPMTEKQHETRQLQFAEFRRGRDAKLFTLKNEK
jgi:hypothetical protein